MITFIQSNLKYVLIVTLVLVGGGLLFFGTGPAGTTGPAASTVLGSINGRSIYQIDLRNAVTTANLAYFFSSRGGWPTYQQEPQIMRNAWQRLIILDAARAQGIDITAEEFRAQVRALPLFQDETGKFDPTLYQNIQTFMQNQHGISEAVFQRSLRDILISGRFEEAMAGPITASAEQLNDVYQRQFGTVTMSVATLKKTAPGEIEVIDAEVQAEYDKRIASAQGTDERLFEPEKRKIRYVFFEVPSIEEIEIDESKVEVKELVVNDTEKPKRDAKAEAIAQAKETRRKELRREVGNKASDFYIRMQATTTEDGEDREPQSLTEAAQSAGIEIIETEFFTRKQTPKGIEPSPNFNNTAFNLAPNATQPQHVVADSGFYIIELVEVQAAQPRPFEEVAGVIRQELLDQKKRTAFQAKATELAMKLKTEVAAGKPFAEAAKALGYTVNELPSFAPGDSQAKVEGLPPNSPARFLGLSLDVGQVSDALPDATGSAVYFLKERAEADDAKYGQYRNALKSRLRSQARELALAEWIRWQEAQPGTNIRDGVLDPNSEG